MVRDSRSTGDKLGLMQLGLEHAVCSLPALGPAVKAIRGYPWAFWRVAGHSAALGCSLTKVLALA